MSSSQDAYERIERERMEYKRLTMALDGLIDKYEHWKYDLSLTIDAEDIIADLMEVRNG